MANETRPRRDSAGTSRIRKSTSSASTPPASDEPGLSHTSPGSPSIGQDGSTPPPDYRDRADRESYREERPADREPIRFRERGDRDRESGLPVRDRLNRSREDRDGPPLTRERDRDREPSPVPNPAQVRDRPREPEGPPISRDRIERDLSP
ncbi:MAG: transcription termination factor Rho, partial [Isosphaeraceae bacterium]